MGAKPVAVMIGGSLDGHSISLREENKDVEPSHFIWRYNAPVYSERIYGVFFCDGGMRAAKEFKVIPQYALLVEPPSLHPENYEFVQENYHLFKYVLTYDQYTLDRVPNAMFYPLGGSSIAFDKWAVYPKTKKVCMIVSEKNSTPGHSLRHRIVEAFPNEIDYYGAGVGKPFERKVDILKEYEYCVVVESELKDHYFSEKLIDAMSVGCIPLHSSSRNNYSCGFFHKHPFGSVEELSDLLLLIRNNQLYYDVRYLHYNLDKARKYAIAEDWLWNNRKELFND